MSHPVPLGDFREDPSGVFSVSPKREVLTNLAEAQRLRLRPCGAAVGSWSAGKSGRFEVQESADTDWGVEPVVNLKAAILERVGTSKQYRGRLVLRPRSWIWCAGEVPAGAVPTLSVSLRKGRGCACQKATQHHSSEGKKRLAHQHGQARAGKCKVPSSLFDLLDLRMAPETAILRSRSRTIAFRSDAGAGNLRSVRAMRFILFRLGNALVRRKPTLVSTTVEGASRAAAGQPKNGRNPSACHSFRAW